MRTLPIERQFASFCADHGLTNIEVLADGVLHRADDPKSKRGNKLFWYVLFPDGQAAGVLGHWRDGWTRTWTQAVPSTESERRLIGDRIQEAQRKRKLAQAMAQQDAIRTAMRIWGSAPPADVAHPYLLRKRLPPHNLRQSGGALLVPLFAPDDGRLVNLQRIFVNGEKRFMRGGRVEGCYWPVGKLKSRLFVCEGMATAASLHRMTGDAVAAAMNTGNLAHVARALQRKHPDIDLVIAADDDRQTPGNPGQGAARKVASELGLMVASPDWPQGAPAHLTDFNDLEAWRAQHEASHL